MKKKLVALAVVMLSGCATQPDKIQSSYVSPIQYKDYDCEQIAAESARVNRRAAELQASLKTAADNDGAQMAVGMILFWPALFLLEGGDGPEAAEYARLKGEREALEEVALQKKCAIPTTVTTTAASDGAESNPATGDRPETPAAAAPAANEASQDASAVNTGG